MFSRVVRLFAFVLLCGNPHFCPSQQPVPAPVQAVAPTAPQIVAPSVGHFVGVVRTQWNDDGRNMTLLEDFSYIDPDGLEWKAPSGLVTDGASIPQLAWSVVGGPFEGPYRLAAVIHDAACDRKDRSWESTHEMFYRAMLSAHVDEPTAKIMYAAVYHFGPRWELIRVANNVIQGDSSAVINNTQRALQSTNSDIKVERQTINHRSGTTTENITMHFIPPPNTFTERDFDSLKQLIVSQEAENPGSVSLEEIRNYHSTGAVR
jgi:hypothetical protein